MGRVYEEKREEEAAPEESQSFARYEPAGHGQPLPGSFLIGMLVLAALAGATIRGRPRPRPTRARRTGDNARDSTTSSATNEPRRRP